MSLEERFRRWSFSPGPCRGELFDQARHRSRLAAACDQTSSGNRRPLATWAVGKRWAPFMNFHGRVLTGRNCVQAASPAPAGWCEGSAPDRDPACQIVEDAVHASHVQAGAGGDFCDGHSPHPEPDDLSVRRGAKCQHPLEQFARLHDLARGGQPRLRLVFRYKLTERAARARRRCGAGGGQ